MTVSLPPKIENFSADKFRVWLAGFAPQDRPPSETDHDAMKRMLVAFLAACPRVYGFEDRMGMWEKIGNAAEAAIESSDGDLLVWANGVLASIGATPGSVASSPDMRAALAGLAGHAPSWQVECLAVMRRLVFVLPTTARAEWERVKEEAAAKREESHHA